MKPFYPVLAAVVLGLGCGGSAPAGKSVPMPAVPGGTQYMINVVNNEAARQVDVTVDGQAFTSFLYWTNRYKPTFYPIESAGGLTVTRGFPIRMVAGERVDHPHQAGAWFNYGDVAGVDFWGHSDSSDTSKGKYGTIVLASVDKIESGQGVGRLDATLDWLGPDGKRMLQEKDKIFFRAAEGLRTIDRLITLYGTDGTVAFPDTKEGMFGIRVARGLEEPSTEPVKYVDEHGNLTEVKAMDNAGVDGEYLTSEGLMSEKQVWGTPAKWCILRGTLEGRPVSLAIFDHPGNVGYPTHWHARGYGLFSANPLGLKDFTQGKEALNFSLAQGGTAAFCYRIVVSDSRLEAESTEALYQQWLKDYDQEIGQ